MSTRHGVKRRGRRWTREPRGTPGGPRALQDPRSGKGWNKDTVVRAANPPAVACRDFWTAKEFRTFERLTAMVCEPDMQARQRARRWLEDFVKKHGKDKCDMMLAEIRRRDEQEWFSEKSRTRGA